MDNGYKLKIKGFLLLTFCISWISWGIIIIANQFGFLQYGTLLSMILFIIGGNGAPIVSYVLLKQTGEIDGVKSFLRCNFNLKASLKSYGLVIILFLAHFIIPIVLASTNRQIPIYFGFFLLPMLLIGGGLEEIGWRGILQPQLEKSMSFCKATIIVAIIWSIWHFPLWLIAGTYQATISFVMFSLSIVGMTFSLALIRKVTNNIFLCILFHALTNSFNIVFMLEQNRSTIITMVVEVVLALGIAFVCDRGKYRQMKSA